MDSTSLQMINAIQNAKFFRNVKLAAVSATFILATVVLYLFDTGAPQIAHACVATALGITLTVASRAGKLAARNDLIAARIIESRESREKN